jgi:hypothetical protein
MWVVNLLTRDETLIKVDAISNDMLVNVLLLREAESIIEDTHDCEWYRVNIHATG